MFTFLKIHYAYTCYRQAETKQSYFSTPPFMGAIAMTEISIKEKKYEDKLKTGPCTL